MSMQPEMNKLSEELIEFDTDLLDFLVENNCLPAIGESLFSLLYREALLICEENIAGNFLVLGEDTTATLMLAWIIRNKTLQPRYIFVADSVYQHYASALDHLSQGFWIKPLDGLLQERNNARNWLGMLDLIYIDESITDRSTVELLRLLSSQLLNQARLVIAKKPDDQCQLLLHLNQLESNCLIKKEKNGILILWKNDAATNPVIPQYLIEQFNQDDPVAAGIPTMMSPNESFQLYYTIRQLLPRTKMPLRFIEIGSFAGGTFYEACMAMNRMQLPYQGITVEPFPSEFFFKVISFLSGNALHLPLKSHDASKKLAEMFENASQPVFILIDGDHSYEAVKQDIQDYYQILAPGGIIMFHDYLPQTDEQNRSFIIDRKSGDEPSIGEACRELLETFYGLTPLELPLLYPANPCQTLAYQPIIPGVFSTIRAYRKPMP